VLVAVSTGGIIISGVVVAVGIISGVLVAAPGMMSGVEVAIGSPTSVASAEDVGLPSAGVDVATGGTGSLAGSITASVPAFCVAPQAPSDVLITPPSIYIHTLNELLTLLVV